MNQRIVFFNIGWMRDYQGLPPDGSDTIEGGGKYVDENKFGFEIFNFQPYSGNLYGYVQPVASGNSAEGRIIIQKLGAGKDDTRIEDVLVVFVARNPKSLERQIVGWYKNATVFLDRQNPPIRSGRIHGEHLIGYYATTKDRNQTLLKEREREDFGLTVPVGKGWMGQSNVWYAQDEKNKDYVAKVLSRVELWCGLNAEEDDTYQLAVQQAEAEKTISIDSSPPSQEEVPSKQWKRDAGIAKRALVKSGFCCEVDIHHKSFTSKVTSKNFVEAHHLIPMSAQGSYESVSLDFEGNIVSLCPNCHRLVHFGASEQRSPIIEMLFERRVPEYASRGIEITVEKLLESYDI